MTNLNSPEIIFGISFLYAIAIYIPTFILLLKKRIILHVLLLTTTIPLSTYLMSFRNLPYGIWIYFAILGSVYYGFFHKKYKSLDKKSQYFINLLVAIPTTTITISNPVFNVFVLYIFAPIAVYYY